MANTLYIVDESPFSTLPKITRDQAIAEVKGIFGFVAGFSVSPTSPSSFPTRFDFTDSVIRVVETDAEVDANQSNRTQTANINFSIRQTGANVQPMPQAGRAPVLPDRGGVGFQNKQVVTSGAQVIAIVITGGFASLESAKTAVVEFLADGKTKEEVEDDRKKAIEGTAKHKPEGLGYFGKHKALVDTRRLMMWEMLAKPLADWPEEHKKSVGGALGRIIAHEARHQYVAAHFNGGGLGADSPSIWGDPNFTKFDTGDQTGIATALRNFTRLQRTVTIHLETNPRNQPFPF
jgi:hypothetical protein